MVDWTHELLLRKTGHDVSWWAELARQQRFGDGAALAAWLRDQHGGHWWG